MRELSERKCLYCILDACMLVSTSTPTFVYDWQTALKAYFSPVLLVQIDRKV